jgi:hypothetical protein
MSDVLGGMPTYQPGRERIQTPGIVPTGGVAEAYGALGATADRLSRAFNDIAEPVMQAQGQQEGRAAVEFGEDGRPRPPQLRSEISSAGRAFNAAAIQAYQDNAESYWSTRFQALRAEHRNDPQAFIGAARGAIEGMSSEIPEAFRGRIVGRLEQVAQAHARGVTADFQQQQVRQAGTAWTMASGQMGEELEAYAVNGQIDSPEAQALLRRYTAHLDAGVASGHINGDIARLQREEMGDRIVANGIAGRVERIAREQGVEAAQRFLIEETGRPEVAAAGQRAVNAARAEGMRRIGLYQQERAVQHGEIRDALTQTRQSINAGATPPVSQLEGLAQRADVAGLPRVAAEFRGLASIRGEATAWAGMTMPQLMTEFVRAQGADVTAPETDVRLRQLSSFIRQRHQQIEQDPVGFAQTQPAVQEAIRGGDINAVVRAQDEVLRANGVDPNGFRVIARAEAERIRGDVSRLPPEQAAARLAEVFNRYGPEHRARLWNDLRDADLPETLRPVAMLLASPNQADALRRYVTLVQEPNALQRLNQTLGQGVAQDIDRAINTTMEPLRRSMSGTAQDVSLMNDARRTIELLATEAVSRGARPADAVREAHRQVVSEGWQVIETSRGAWRVPRGVRYDNEQFTRVTRDLIGNGVLDNVRFNIPDGAIARDIPDDERQRAYRASLAASGSWRSEPDGRGVMLVNSAGQPVFLDDGRVFRVRFDEVREGIYPTGNPRGVRPDLSILRPTSGFYGRLAGQETGGQADPDNARPMLNGRALSSASGRFQFTEGTWLEFARENRAMFPIGTSREALLAMRSDPIMQMRATHWYAQQNATQLQGAGQTASDWTIGLAHTVGGGGAVSVLRAPDNASLRDVLGAAAMEANPWWRGLTAGQFRERFRTRYGDGQTWRVPPVIGQQVASAGPTMPPEPTE